MCLHRGGCGVRVEEGLLDVAREIHGPRMLRPPKRLRHG
jgi:hypothetical protein